MEVAHLPREDHSRHLLPKHAYTLKLSRQGGAWAIDHVRIDIAWLTDGPEVFSPASP